MDRDTEIHYTKLNAIDGKTGGLLQITAILLVLASLPLTLGGVAEAQERYIRVFILVFLVSGLLSLFSMWFAEAPSTRLVRLRVVSHNLTVVLTALGLLGTCVAILSL